MNVRTLPRPAAPSAPPRSRRRWVALVVLLPLVLGGVALWWLVLRHDSPVAVDLDQALAGIESTAPAQAAAQAPETAADGTWTIDRTITNARGTGSFAGFRIGEVLVGVGSTTAVGRTTSVKGTMSVSGSTATAAQITADLTAITTNDSRRDSAVQRALATSRHPDATFVLTRPIQASAVPADGERVSLAATGDLTIRGTTRPVTVDVEAQLQGAILVVVGSAPVVLADYGVTAPTAPVVASVEDRGTFEFQLYFTKS